MPKAQEYLNQSYINKGQTTQIGAKNQNLSGELTIQDFPALKKIDLSNNKDLN
ncbi:16319_t:CDS:1, partial [Funneliformis geosporum]